MKMSVFSILTLVFMMLILVPNSTAEDSPQWHLPDGAIARLGKGAPRGIQYSPDGTRIAVATGSGVWIYDTRTGEEFDLLTVEETPEELNVFRGWEADVRAIAYSPDGNILAIAGGYQVQLWDTVSGQRKTTLTGHTSSISNVAFSPDGHTLASSSIFSEIRLWDVNTGQYKKSLWGHTAYVASLSFSPDGHTLASASSDKTIRLWDTVNERHKATLKHTSSVKDIAFSPDGQALASVSSDGTVQLWNAVNGQHKAIFEHKFWCKGVAFSPDGHTLAIGLPNGVQLWDVNTMQLKKTLAQGHVLWVSEVTFSPDGQELAITDHAGVHLWHVQRDQHRTTLSHIEKIYDIAFNPDGQTLATSNSGYEIWLWNIQTGTYIGKYGTPLIENTRYPFENIAFSPDGSMLAGVNAKNTVLWDAVNGQHKATLKHTESVRVIAFSPDGQTLVSGSSDGTVQLWDVNTAQPKNRLMGHTTGVRVIAFSPDGQTLVSGSSDGIVQLWDVNTAQLKATLTAEGATYVASLAFSPDSKTIASAWGTRVWLWNARTGEHQITLKSTNCLINEADFTSDNNTLIITDAYGRVRLWDIARDSELKTFVGDKGLPKVGAIRSLNIALSRDGHTLASASSEGPVFLWNITPFTTQQTQPEPDTQQTQDDTPIQRYEREMVRLIYFRPTDRPSRQGINTELDTLIRWTQYFFAEQMQDYGRKTFAFETDDTGHAQVHHVTGKFTDTYYHSDTYNKVVKEVAEHFDTSRDVFLIAVDVSSEFINQEGTCGIGGGGWKSFDNERWRRDFGGTAVIPASGVCINPSIAAHELGHVFGLEHDFRDDTYLMAYGTQERLSHCAAEWLDAHRFFNNDPTSFNDTGAIDIQVSSTSTPGNLRLQFELADADGLHQAQLIVPTAAGDPAPGTKLHSCKPLNAKNQTVEFLTTNATVPSDSEVTLQVIDATGNITRQAFSLAVVEDDMGVPASPIHQLAAMEAPPETTLLPNYPNPFNPETWIPYQLSAPADVTVYIHAVDGNLVRCLPLGYRTAGIYHSRSRAAYWDGRNELDEPVANGVYFYTLTADKFNATRKMIIRK